MVRQANTAPAPSRAAAMAVNHMARPELRCVVFRLRACVVLLTALSAVRLASLAAFLFPVNVSITP